MASQVVTYRVDDSTLASFEIEPPEGFHPASGGEIAGRVRDAVGPALEAAKAVLDKVREAKPAHVEVKFGVKVSGGASWLVARTMAEGNFEITMTWASEASDSGEHGEGQV